MIRDREEVQEYSEIGLFNAVGLMARDLGYEVVYFKSLTPSFLGFGEDLEIDYKYIHFIHLYKDEELKISIYYDKYNLAPMFPEQPYFELYDRLDTERFLDTEEDRNNLVNRLSELLK